MSNKYGDIIEWKKKFDKELISDEEIAYEIAEEEDFDKGAFWDLVQLFETRKLQYVMNGVSVKGLLGTISKKLYKGREIKGFTGQIETIPDRELIKVEFPERFAKVFTQNEYYDYFLGRDYELIIYITKDTPKIKSGEASYFDCMKVISDCLWKNHTQIITETEEELDELEEKLLEFISEERENNLRTEIKSNKDNKTLRKLREELRILEVLKRNYETQRIRFICEQ